VLKGLNFIHPSWNHLRHSDQEAHSVATRHPGMAGTPPSAALGGNPASQQLRWHTQGNRMETAGSLQSVPVKRQAHAFASRLLLSGEAPAWLKRHEELMAAYNPSNVPTLWQAASRESLKALAHVYKIDYQVAVDVHNLLRPHRRRAPTPPRPPVTPARLSAAQIDTLGDLYGSALLASGGKVAAARAQAMTDFKTLFGQADFRQAERELDKISQPQQATATPQQSALSPRELSANELDTLRDIYATLRAAPGTDAIAAASEAASAFMQMFPGTDSRALEKSLQDLIGKAGESGIRPAQERSQPQQAAPITRAPLSETQSVESQRWKSLSNNCAEKAVFELAAKFNRPLPDFAYARNDVWDGQVELGNFVAACNRKNDIPQVHIQPAANRQSLQAGFKQLPSNEQFSVLKRESEQLASDVCQTLEQGGRDKMYLMRTGYQNGAGHFQLVYFDDKHERWHAYSSQGNQFAMTDQAGAPTETCCTRLRDRSPNYSVTLDRLNPDDIGLYADFIVGCRDKKVPMDIDALSRFL
jgi:hypothetical protein